MEVNASGGLFKDGVVLGTVFANTELYLFITSGIKASDCKGRWRAHNNLYTCVLSSFKVSRTSQLTKSEEFLLGD